jgi:hypothetical protein
VMILAALAILGLARRPAGRAAAAGQAAAAEQAAASGPSAEPAPGRALVTCSAAATED